MIQDVQLASGAASGHPVGLLHHLLLLFLSRLHTLLGRLLLDDHDREIVTLRQPLSTMQRQLGKQLPLATTERLALLLFGVFLCRRRLLATIVIVTPAVLGMGR